jgi:tRNA A37 threonylcarbamoyladenosine synthetase subunit TsaC/SUA5/YrdC
VVATATEARQTFGDAVAVIVDGGRLAERSSTVIDATTSPWRLLRDGPIAAEDIFTTGLDAAG